MSKPIPGRLAFRCVLLFGLGAFIFAAAWLGFGLSPARPGSRLAQTVEIPYGTGIARIADLLHRRKLLRNPLVFRTWAKLSGGERLVKAGTYALTPGMDARGILAVLTEGRAIAIRATIPEGSSLQDIAAILDKRAVATGDAFLKLASDPAVIGAMAPDANGASLEGFLFPDTYNFNNAAGGEGAIRLMAARFGQVWTPAMRARAAAMGRSVREIVIMASIVEREAKKPGERALIASVFYNRLRVGIALQSCATVMYALGMHKDRLTYHDLHYQSPYNTYIWRGLPPAPICCPGLASIQAALYPAPGNYRYFVARHDGTHVFSETYREHLRAQREIARGLR